MDAVVRYLQGVDAAAAARASELYAPYRPYADRQTALGYAAAPADLRTQVRANLAEVESLLAAQEARYVAASSPRAFADASRHARIVLQAEAVYAVEGGDSERRDAFMAENTQWLLDQAGPDARLVLWSHNDHVQKDSAHGSSMGVALDGQLGARMVVVGFAFGHGACTARRPGGQLGPQDVAPPIAGSYEEAFSRSGRPRFLLDTRGLSRGAPGPDWYLAGHPHRSIGGLYDPTRPEQYFGQAFLARMFDLVVYFENTTASRVY
jgi:erythromycin esterase